MIDVSTSVTCPCCFMLPAVETVAPDGRNLGRSQYVCDLYCLVPKYDVYDKSGSLQYKGKGSVHIRANSCLATDCIFARDRFANFFAARISQST